MNEVRKHYGLEEDGTSGGGQGWDVPGTARRAVRDTQERAGEAYDQASEWARGRYDEASRWASHRYGDVARKADQARRQSAQHYDRGRDTIGRFVEENPIMVGVAGLAAGLLIGALLPRTRQEDEYFGRYADDVRGQGLRYAQDLAQQGREAVEENLARTRASLRSEQE